MEADIPAANVRVFARALSTLSRIGDVLIVETAPDRLLLRALSQAQSSYAQISFAPSFFIHYSIAPIAGAANVSLTGGLSGADAEDTADFSYRTRPPSAFSTTGSSPSPSPLQSTAPTQQAHKVIVNSKACLAPFRGAVSMIKRLTIKLTTTDDCGYGELSTQHNEKAQWQQQQSSQRGKRKRARVGGESERARRAAAEMELEKDLCLMVQLHLDDLGVTKTYRIPTTEQTNILQPDFSRQSCPTVLSAKASKFQSWLTNFQNESVAYTSIASVSDLAAPADRPCCFALCWSTHSVVGLPCVVFAVSTS